MRVIGAAIRALVRLVFDDGLVFAGTLGSLVVAWVLSRPSLLGPTNVVGWLLFAMIAATLLGSFRRAGRRR